MDKAILNAEPAIVCARGENHANASGSGILAGQTICYSKAHPRAVAGVVLGGSDNTVDLPHSGILPGRAVIV